MRVNRIASKLASALTALLFTFPAMGAELPVVELGAGMYRIEAELAATPQSRQIGLMNRNTMAPQHGMVFVFTEDQRNGMSMKYTLIPLTVAFLGKEGRILNL